MAGYTVPVVDTEVDSDDPDGSVMNVVGAILGFLTLFGIVGAASYAFNRAKEAVGVDGDASVPGI